MAAYIAECSRRAAAVAHRARRPAPALLPCTGGQAAWQKRGYPLELRGATHARLCGTPTMHCVRTLQRAGGHSCGNANGNVMCAACHCACMLEFTEWHFVLYRTGLAHS